MREGPGPGRFINYRTDPFIEGGQETRCRAPYGLLINCFRFVNAQIVKTIWATAASQKKPRNDSMKMYERTSDVLTVANEAIADKVSIGPKIFASSLGLGVRFVATIRGNRAMQFHVKAGMMSAEPTRISFRMSKS